MALPNGYVAVAEALREYAGSAAAYEAAGAYARIIGGVTVGMGPAVISDGVCAVFAKLVVAGIYFAELVIAGNSIQFLFNLAAEPFMV